MFLDLLLEELGHLVLEPIASAVGDARERREIRRSMVAPVPNARGRLSFSTTKRPDGVVSALLACGARNGYRLESLSDDRRRIAFRAPGASRRVLVVTVTRHTSGSFVEVGETGHALRRGPSGALSAACRLFRSAAAAEV